MTVKNETMQGSVQPNREANRRFLAIDTSTSSMTLAVLENDHLLGDMHTHAERNHSIGLLPNIRELLTSLELKPKDLQAVVVGNGPGSYTGVRIGVTVGKTFAWSLGIDLVGVSSLEAMALGGRRRWLTESTHAKSNEQDRPTVQWIVPLMDARRTQAFTAVYEAKGNWTFEDGLSAFSSKWQTLLPDGILLMQNWVERLVQLAADAAYRDEVTGNAGSTAPDHIVFVGETAGFESMLSYCREHCAAAVHVIPHAIDAYDIGILGGLKLAAGDLADVHAFVPNYTQLPEAEVKLRAKAQKGDD